MKTFLKKIILFMVCVIAIVLAINALYMRKDDAYKEQVAHYANVPYGIQVSCYGSSHEAGGINVDLLPDVVGFNFANAQQLPLYDVRLMECYEDHLAEGGTALIGLSYFSLRHMPLAETPEFESYNKQNYWNLPDEYVYHYDRKTDVYVTKLPSLTAGFELFPTVFRTEETEAEKKTMEDAYMNQSITHEEALEAAKNRYETYVDRHRGSFNQECADAVYRMIAICRSHDITPVLISTPVIAEVSDYIREQNPAFFDMFYGDIETICRDTGVRYYNYLEDERFVHDYALFMDADHLNRAGAETYTKVIAREILGTDY